VDGMNGRGIGLPFPLLQGPLLTLHILTFRSCFIVEGGGVTAGLFEKKTQSRCLFSS